MATTTDPSLVPIKLTILSGHMRGRTVNISSSEFRVGAAEDCDLKFDSDPEVQPHHAEIVQENCDVYLRRSAPDAQVVVNHQEVSEIILQDGDLISFGLTGPRARLRLPPERFLACKPVIEICRDCLDMVRFAEAPAHRKAGMAVRHMTRELVHQTTRVFKIAVVSVLIALLGGAGGYVWWSTRQFRRYEAVLAQLAERSERERRNLIAKLSQVQESAKESSAEQEQRLENLKGSLSESSGGEIRRLEEQVQSLRQEFDFAPPVAARNSGGVCFIVGAYGFIERATGKELRFAGIDSQGQPLKDSSGQVRIVVGDQGVPVIRQYTGTGFLISADGQILTNHHVAEPWFEDEEDKQIIQHGFQPVQQSLLAYFPGDERAYRLAVLRNSVVADVSLLKTELGKRRPPVLTLSRDKARVGEPILLLGYPAGYEALMARYSEQTIKSIMNENPTTPEQLSRALARRNLIRPIATQGHLGDVLKDRLVYDAQTTHGGSGGPILNSRGEVIGINFAILEGFSGSNFGVPADQARALLPR